MRAKDICRRDMIKSDEHASIVDVAKLMREHGIGDVVVTQSQGNKTVPIGVVTDRDIVVHAIACDIALADVAAGDLSKRTLVTVDGDCDVLDITSAMNQHGVRRLLITEGSEIIGIVTLDDVLLAVREIVSNLSASLGRQIRCEQEANSDGFPTKAAHA